MTHTLLTPASRAWASTLALPDGYLLAHYDGALNAYVPFIVDLRPAALLIDATQPDWARWCAASKNSPATRRTPVIIVGELAPAHAADVSADAVLPASALIRELPALLARLSHAANTAALCADCELPLPALGEQGLAQFNAREFYRQHDSFEALWMATESPVRDLYRAILQVGVAYYQIERGNLRGALKMLMRATQWLEALPNLCQTVDVAQLRQDAYAVRHALEHRQPDDPTPFDLTLLKPVMRVFPE